MKTLISVLFVFCFLGALFADNCADHDPVCASKSGKHKTFANACEANRSGFAVQHEGACFKKMQKITHCNAKCKVDWKIVCGEADGKIRPWINECFAKCDNATNITEGKCASRQLAFAWVTKLVDAVKNAFNKTERWIEDKSQALANKSKQVWHQIGDKWEQCNCEPFNDVVNWAKKVANKTEEFAERTVEELQIIERNTIDGFALFRQKVKEDLQKIKNATIEAAKKFVNRTKEFFQKVGRFIKNVTLEVTEWIIEEGHSLKNRTATWWHKTKEGLENCTCCLVEETDELLDEIAEAAERALNKTKAKLEQLKNRLRSEFIRLHDKGEAALERTEKYFKALWPCICPKTYEPVCVKTEEGDQATILNHCFADCPKMNLQTVFNGTCEAMNAEDKDESN